MRSRDHACFSCLGFQCTVSMVCPALLSGVAWCCSRGLCGDEASLKFGLSTAVPTSSKGVRVHAVGLRSHNARLRANYTKLTPSCCYTGRSSSLLQSVLPIRQCFMIIVAVCCCCSVASLASVRCRWRRRWPCCCRRRWLRLCVYYCACSPGRMRDRCLAARVLVYATLW